MPNDTPFTRQIQTVLQDELKYSDYTLPINPYYEDSTFNDAWSKHLEEALYSSATFDEMTVNIEKDVNKTITQGRSA